MTPVFEPVPKGVEVCRRVQGQKQVVILINHTQEKQHITFSHPMKMLLKDGKGPSLDLPAYGVEVLVSDEQ